MDKNLTIEDMIKFLSAVKTGNSVSDGIAAVGEDKEETAMRCVLIMDEALALTDKDEPAHLIPSEVARAADKMLKEGKTVKILDLMLIFIFLSSTHLHHKESGEDILDKVSNQLKNLSND